MSLEEKEKEIKNKWGSQALVRFSDKVNLNIDVIPSGNLALDLALGVLGYPRGRILEIVGVESSGKCLPIDTRIVTNQGLMSVGEIFESQGINPSCTTKVTPIDSVHLMNRYGEYESTTALVNNGKKSVHKITTFCGEIISTPNHPHLVMNSRGSWVWKQTRDIEAGDYLIRQRETNYPGVEYDKDLCYFMGVCVADGYFGENRVSITNNDPAIQTVIRTEGTKLFKIPKEYVQDNGSSIEFHFSIKEKVQDFYSTWGLFSGLAKDKIVSKQLRTLGPESRKAFIRGYMDCECSIAPEKSALEVTSASKDLLVDIQYLLQSFGITSYLRQKKVKAYPDNEYFRLNVSGDELRKYYEVIGFGTQQRIDSYNQIKQNKQLQTNHDTIPNIGLLLDDLYLSSETTREHHKALSDYKGSNPKANISYNKLEKALDLDWTESSTLYRLREILSYNYVYDKVLSKEVAGEVPTFDFTMSRSSSFIANGFVTHNTSIALHAIASAQSLGLNCAFIDFENSLDATYANNLEVNLDNLLISQPDYAEMGFEIVTDLIDSGEMGLIVVDSVAAATPRAEILGEAGDSHVGLQARLMSQLMRKINHSANVNHTTVIFINQIREKIGVTWGSNETTPGGRALKFYASQRLDIRRVESIKSGTDVTGAKTRIKVVKNKVAVPFKECTVDIMYGEGISKEGSLIDIGVEHDIIKKSGVWFYGPDDVKLGQGRENAKEYLKANSEYASNIYNLVIGKIKSE